MAIEHIENYDAFRLGTRENKKPKGFTFDMDTFENTVDAFTSESDICTLLNVTEAQLDRFCAECYNGMTFASVYRQLKAVSVMFMKKAIKGHAENGNVYAMRLAAENWLGMADSGNKEQSVTITFKDDRDDC